MWKKYVLIYVPVIYVFRGHSKFKLLAISGRLLRYSAIQFGENGLATCKEEAMTNILTNLFLVFAVLTIFYFASA